MKHTVVWLKSAEAKLARIWNEATDRRAVTRAGHTIDAQLASDPHNCGESRPEDVRIHFVPPLAVTFSIDADDRIVRVARMAISSPIIVNCAEFSKTSPSAP